MTTSPNACSQRFDHPAPAMPPMMRPLPSRPRVLLLAASALAVAGCASQPGGPQSLDLTCNSAQQCRVVVTVDCPSTGCRIAVDHPQVFARGNDIVWIVANKPGQAYAFPVAAGIAFKTAAGQGGFSCHVEASGNRYACMNRGVPGRHEYAVRLDGSPAVPPLDPWIVNN